MKKTDLLKDCWVCNAHLEHLEKTQLPPEDLELRLILHLGIELHLHLEN